MLLDVHMHMPGPAAPAHQLACPTPAGGCRRCRHSADKQPGSFGTSCGMSLQASAPDDRLFCEQLASTMALMLVVLGPDRLQCHSHAWMQCSTLLQTLGWPTRTDRAYLKCTSRQRCKSASTATGARQFVNSSSRRKAAMAPACSPHPRRLQCQHRAPSTPGNACHPAPGSVCVCVQSLLRNTPNPLKLANHLKCPLQLWHLLHGLEIDCKGVVWLCAHVQLNKLLHYVPHTQPCRREARHAAAGAAARFQEWRDVSTHKHLP